MEYSRHTPLWNNVRFSDSKEEKKQHKPQQCNRIVLANTTRKRGRHITTITVHNAFFFTLDDSISNMKMYGGHSPDYNSFTRVSAVNPGFSNPICRTVAINCCRRFSCTVNIFKICNPLHINAKFKYSCFTSVRLTWVTSMVWLKSKAKHLRKDRYKGVSTDMKQSAFRVWTPPTLLNGTLGNRTWQQKLK